MKQSTKSGIDNCCGRDSKLIYLALQEKTIDDLFLKNTYKVDGIKLITEDTFSGTYFFRSSNEKHRRNCILNIFRNRVDRCALDLDSEDLVGSSTTMT